jgi:hypothetical protein
VPPHLKVAGKGGKTRYLPLHPGTHALIHDYLDAVGHGTDESGALFRAVRNNRTSSANGSAWAATGPTTSCWPSWKTSDYADSLRR